MHLQVHSLGDNTEVSVSRSKPQNICSVLAYSKVVSEQNYVAGSCKAIVGRKNILGEKIVCKPPTRSKLRIIVCRPVSCEAIRSKGTVGSKQAFELIWIESQVRGKSLTHGHCVGKPSCQVQCEYDPGANGIPKTHCEARPRRTVMCVRIHDR